MHDAPKPQSHLASRTLDLQEIVQVHSALQAGDDDALKSLRRSSSDVVAFEEAIHREVATNAHYVDLGPRRRVFWHGCLWMLPVVLRAEAVREIDIPKDATQRLQLGWGGQPTMHLVRMLSLHDVLNLQPGQTRRLLDCLTGFGDAPALMQQPDSWGEHLPRLAFMVGATKAANRELQWPTLGFSAEMPKIQAALEYACHPGAGSGAVVIQVGHPQCFSEALVSGLSLWLNTIHSICHIESCAMDLVGDGLLAMTLDLGSEVRRGEIGWVLKHWLIGHAGQQQLAEHCQQWFTAFPWSQHRVDGAGRPVPKHIGFLH